MREVLIESSTQFKESVFCSLEVVVSEKNLISDDEIETTTRQLMSRFEKITVHVVVFHGPEEKARIKIDVKHFQESEFLLGALELFLHYLGNVRVYHKKIEYRLLP